MCGGRVRPAKRRDEPGDAQLLQDFQRHVQRWPGPVKRVKLAGEKPSLREPARNPSTPRNQRASSTRGPRRQHHQLHSSGHDFVTCGRARDGSPIAGRRRCLGGMGCPWRLHELPAAPSSDTRRLECSVVHSRAAVRRVESQKLDAEALVVPSPNFSRLQVAVWCRAAFWGAAGVLRRRGGGRAAAQLAINSPK